MGLRLGPGIDAASSTRPSGTVTVPSQHLFHLMRVTAELE
jgi:hypothetical protein